MLSSKKANILNQVSKETYDRLTNNYESFKNILHDASTEPVKVFNPLSQKQLDELELIREVSRELQLKKDEDIKKQQQAASQAEEEAKKAAEEAANNEKEDTEKTE